MVLPEMNGVDYAAHLRDVFPEIRIVFITGWAQHHYVDKLAPSERLLLKPFTKEELLRTVSAG